MSLDDFWDDWADEELESVGFVRNRPQREADLKAALVTNDARWKAEQASLAEQERRAAEARIEAPSQANRRRRAAMAAVLSEPYTRREVFERDGGRCYMCYRRLGRNWHVEHVIPIARGGPDTFDNVRAACPRCNLRKGTQEPCYRK